MYTRLYIHTYIMYIYIYIYILFLFNISYNIAFNISFHLFLFYLTLHISFPFQKENQINIVPEIKKMSFSIEIAIMMVLCT